MNLLPTPETHGKTGSVHPKRSQKTNVQNANSFVLRVEALLSGIVLGGQTQSFHEFQEWAIAYFVDFIGLGCLGSNILITLNTIVLRDMISHFF